MSNLSGIPDNKTFRTIAAPGEPYYYIRAKLDLSGQLANNNVLYFNAENTLAYKNTSVFAYPSPDAYPNFHKIDEHVLIGEVVASSNPDLIYAGGEGEVRASGVEIQSVARNGSNVATITLNASAASFGLATGDYVLISNITNSSNSFNTSVPVQITVSGNTFTYGNNGAVVATTAALGNSREIMTPVLIQIGGAYKPSTGSASIDLWGGPSGNIPAPISLAQLEHAQSCYYGAEPAAPESNPSLGKRKFLAVKLSGGNAVNKITRGVLSVVIKVYPKFW
jgi:hypothetical protein